MQYVQSNTLANYWEEIKYVPDYFTNLHLIHENESLTLKEKLSAYKTVLDEAGESDKVIEDHITTMNKYISKFEKDELDNYVVYACGEVNYDNEEYMLCNEHFNTFYQLKFHIRKQCEKMHIRECEFRVAKVYPKQDCLSMYADYRFKNNEFEIMFVSWDNGLGESEEENASRFINVPIDEKELPIPFIPGDILINCNYSSIYVVGEDRDFYSLAIDENKILKSNIHSVSSFEYINKEQWDSLGAKYNSLLILALCLKNSTPIPQEIQDIIISVEDQIREFGI